MSFSGTRRSVKKKPVRVYEMKRLGVQLLEIVALISFFVGIGIDNLAVMAAAAAAGWAAVALSYMNFRKDMAKRSPEKRDALSVPKFTLYIAFTLAAALTLMTALSLVT